MIAAPVPPVTAATTTTPSSPGLAPTAFSASGVARFAASVGHTVYWAGPMAGMRYEVTESPTGSIYVRYLPPGVAVGSPTQHLIVATYPVDDAYTVTSNAATGSSAVSVPVGSGSIALLQRVPSDERLRSARRSERADRDLLAVAQAGPLARHQPSDRCGRRLNKPR